MNGTQLLGRYEAEAGATLGRALRAEQALAEAHEALAAQTKEIGNLREEVAHLKDLVAAADAAPLVADCEQDHPTD